MSLLYKPLERITHEDIQSLIDNQIRESQFIEYKTEVFDKRDEKKRIQFLGSISGFANSLGGDLLVGVKATGGIPVAIPGLDPQSVDQEMLRIREVVANWVEPYLPIHTHPITLPDGKCLIVVRILRSWNPPHGIPNNEQYHFYRRNSAGRAPMTLSELRDSFTLSAGVADRVRAFREKRSVLLQSGSLGVYGIKPTILFHVIPFAGMTGANFIDLTAVPPQSLSPVRMQGGYIETGETRFNLDGLLMHDKGSERPTHWHTQLFRNGAFEYADTDFVERHEASSGWYVNAFQLQRKTCVDTG